MTETNVPACLNHAREEMLLALGASTEADAIEHRRLADEYMIEAVEDLHREPGREHDWSELRAHRQAYA
ncbi:MAG: hypothetical protein KDE55_11745 [Novosphingobium sp.]|nr:hypothetical protein [Novosphingobium sp.]